MIARAPVSTSNMLPATKPNLSPTLTANCSVLTLADWPAVSSNRLSTSKSALLADTSSVLDEVSVVPSVPTDTACPDSASTLSKACREKSVAVVCRRSPAKTLALSAISTSARPAVMVASRSIAASRSCADRENSDEKASILAEAVKRASELSTVKVSAAEAVIADSDCNVRRPSESVPK